MPPQHLLADLLLLLAIVLLAIPVFRGWHAGPVVPRPSLHWRAPESADNKVWRLYLDAMCVGSFAYDHFVDYSSSFSPVPQEGLLRNAHGLRNRCIARGFDVPMPPPNLVKKDS